MALPALPVRPLQEILDEAVYREEAMEIVFTDQRRGACTGGGARGHPKVYYTIGEKGYADCMYCDRLYVFDPSKAGQVIEGGHGDKPLLG